MPLGRASSPLLAKAGEQLGPLRAWGVMRGLPAVQNELRRAAY